MTDDRSFERAARSWLETGPTRAPERALEAAFLQIDSTPQERDWLPWRLPKMTTPLRVASAAVIGVLAIGGAIYLINPLGSSSGIGGPGPTPSPTPSPVALSEAPLAAGRYVTAPFAPDGTDAWFGVCMAEDADCTEDPADDTVRISFTVPDGWSGAPRHSVWLTTEGAAPMGAWVTFQRGANLYSEPCGNTPPPDIPVGPTVDDFVDALVVHPKLDVSTPTDVAIDGFRGKYLDLQVPADITACLKKYWPWEPGFFAQGPSQRWHLWVLDVDGVRVLINAMDFEATAPQRQAELRAIVESIQIEP